MVITTRSPAVEPAWTLSLSAANLRLLEASVNWLLQAQRDPEVRERLVDLQVQLDSARPADINSQSAQSNVHAGERQQLAARATTEHWERPQVRAELLQRGNTPCLELGVPAAAEYRQRANTPCLEHGVPAAAARSSELVPRDGSGLGPSQRRPSVGSDGERSGAGRPVRW